MPCFITSTVKNVYIRSQKKITEKKKICERISIIKEVYETVLR